MSTEDQRLLAQLTSNHMDTAQQTIGHMTRGMRSAAENLTGEEDPREVLRSLADIFDDLFPKQAPQ